MLLANLLLCVMHRGNLCGTPDTLALELTANVGVECLPSRPPALLTTIPMAH